MNLVLTLVYVHVIHQVKIYADVVLKILSPTLEEKFGQEQKSDEKFFSKKMLIFGEVSCR